jgi:hypothetical protein
MSNPVSLELQQKIAIWRQRATANELTLDEMKEAVLFLRAGRVAAAQAASTKKRSVAAPSADDMLADLEGL